MHKLCEFEELNFQTNQCVFKSVECFTIKSTLWNINCPNDNLTNEWHTNLKTNHKI